MMAHQIDHPFNSPEWIYEIKWDGIRALSYVGPELRIESRNQKELYNRFPELEELKKLTNNVVLDGEIVVMKKGIPRFQLAIKRSQNMDPRQVERLSRELPAIYVVFDILEKDGDPLIDLPLTERKDVLQTSLREGRHVVNSLYVEEEGKKYYKAAIQKGLEGIMAKRKESRYQPGLRSRDWLKVTHVKTVDCIIFGYTEGLGERERTFGALVLGLYEKGTPIFVGKVGTGFTQEDLEELMKTFLPLETSGTTLEGFDLPDRVTWLKPWLVAKIGYHSITRDERLRAARYLGLREDKEPKECIMKQIRNYNIHQYL
jgi:DNA ligase D-like protein (predicted ligase)